ncbi:MAG: type II secretion system F family protein [Candidatus Nanoarchaeia archaeon]|jgi:flagellar protein FlaJ|nr:type II secretion system F family protein [Candidatus Nanoarchaeia archaeon]|tara:strand:+ start:3628 stop:4497 length:870 start_codon:yes stop_codon:yes gene_type:complete
MDVYEKSSKVFSGFVKKHKYFFEALEPKLRVAKIKVPVEAYASFVIMMGVVSAAVAFLFLNLIGIVALGFSFLGLLLNLIVSIFIGSFVSGFVYLYPNFKINETKDKISNSLAFVAIYMSTLAKSGFTPQRIFEMLAKFKDYSVVSAEAEKIDHEVNRLGTNLSKVLERAIKRSPSPEWTEFLAGIRNSVVVGGDLSKYLEEKAHGFVQEYRRKLQSFSKTLTLLMNMYITLIIVGTVFFIVVSSLMGAVGGISTTAIKIVHYLVIFLGLPVLTAMLIIIIRSSSPWAE